jgi:predicted kinase
VEAVLFIGLQASGKSSFFRERFFATHIRVNLDMLKTRFRERQLLETCLRIQQAFVIDNTNPTKEDRRPFVEAAKAAGFRIVGYYFQSKIEDCKSRNGARPTIERIPVLGLLRTYANLELPGYDEGFDELFYVRLNDDGFVVEEWQNEVR